MRVHIGVTLIDDKRPISERLGPLRFSTNHLYSQPKCTIQMQSAYDTQRGPRITGSDRSIRQASPSQATVSGATPDRRVR